MKGERKGTVSNTHRWPIDLYNRLKVLADTHNLPVQHVLNTAVERLLEQEEGDSQGEA